MPLYLYNTRVHLHIAVGIHCAWTFVHASPSTYYCKMNDDILAMQLSPTQWTCATL